MNVDRTQRRTFLWLLTASLAYFIFMAWPNATGAQDFEMVRVFSDDEAIQLSYTLDMLAPADGWKGSLYNFFFYRYYFYGYPFFAYSASLLLPLRLLEQLDNLPVIMWLMRQFVSVLPMLGALLLLVFLQTRFKPTLKSVLLFGMLLSLPAVTANSLRWHPDSLAFLFVTLTLFFLVRDDLRFGPNFLLAALACGLATGTKLLGVYFFLTIPLYLGLGLYHKRLTWPQATIKALLFVLVMLAAVLVSNPLLVFAGIRQQYLQVQLRQAADAAAGFEIGQGRGLRSWLPVLQTYYGHLFFLGFALLSTLLASLWGIRRRENLLILSWALPFSIYILSTIAIKPFHYFLPALLPLISSLAALWPPLEQETPYRQQQLIKVLTLACLAVSAIQLLLNLDWNLKTYQNVLEREQVHPAIRFETAFRTQVLEQMAPPSPLRLYHDIQFYLPNIPAEWDRHSSYELLDQLYIEDLQPDLVLLNHQRILDYTNPENLEHAGEGDGLVASLAFYQAARQGQLPGYQLVYQDDFGLAFVSEELYQDYFSIP